MVGLAIRATVTPKTIDLRMAITSVIMPSPGIGKPLCIIPTYAITKAGIRIKTLSDNQEKP